MIDVAQLMKIDVEKEIGFKEIRGSGVSASMFAVKSEWIVGAACVQITHTFEPVVGVGDHVVEDGGISTCVTCECDVRKCLPLMIRAGTKCHVGKSAQDVKWDRVPIRRDRALDASNPHGFIMHLVFAPLHLPA